MNYRLTITPRPDYLHAVVIGVNSRETVERYLAEVLRECQARGARRLLIEERLEGPRLQTVDVFRIATGGGENAQGQFDAIAYVDANAEGGLMKFAETVATNRGLPVAVFNTVDQAVRWLQEQPHK